MNNRKFYLVCYDIKDNKRRTNVFKKMRNYGTRVQFSVFECIIDEKMLEKMIKEMLEIINEDEDSIRIYNIPESYKKFIKILGVGEVVRDEKYFIV